MSAAVGTWYAASVVVVGWAALLLIIALAARRRGARGFLDSTGPTVLALGCLLYLITTSVALSIALLCLIWGLLDRNTHGQDGQRVGAAST